MDTLKQLFEDYRLQKKRKPTDCTIEPIAGSGGNRKYWRIRYRGGSVIAARGTDLTENETFFYLSEHLREKGLNVPQILCISEDRLSYLQEDVGVNSLFDLVGGGRQSGVYSDNEKTLLHKAVSMLPALQIKGAEGLDVSRCRPIGKFDKTSVMFDLNYFKYCFLKLSGLNFDELALERDFELLASKLTECQPNDAFIHRDFQGRNILISKGARMSLIDYQGGRMGPVHYDLVSFLWQARARYSPQLKAELTDTYIEAMKEFRTLQKDVFVRELRHFALFRTLQVLGAYGLRGLHERKGHFLDSIPAAMENIVELLAEPFPEYPYLSEILLKAREHFLRPATVQTGVLSIRIYSFSYKKGIPYDVSGNGGGYVFDCRGLYNPGRQDIFKDLTGMDAAVADFIEKIPESHDFAEAAIRLADLHIDNFLSRGFSDLMFCFGCTGGRHRSVYFAEKLAAHIDGKYIRAGKPVKVRLIHREQNIEKEL